MTRNTRNTSNGRFPGGFAPEEDDDLPKSKSQRKRDMTALQDLGVELEALPKDRLARVPMPEALSDAILQARKITSHEGKRLGAVSHAVSVTMPPGRSTSSAMRRSMLWSGRKASPYFETFSR